MRLPIVATLLLILAGSSSWADEGKDANVDKRAFERARKAATAESWDAAIAIMDTINIDKLDDVDVIEYVVFSKLCARTADSLGINRKSNPDSPTDVVTKIDWPQLIANLAGQSLKDPIKVAGILSDARKVQKGIPQYQRLDAKLANRYGIK